MWQQATVPTATATATCLWPSLATRRTPQQVRCSSAPEAGQPRRLANYQSNSRDYDALLSLKGGANDLVCTSGLDKLKGGIKNMMHKISETSSKLRLIDIMQRLGIAYHFEEDISGILSSISMESDNAHVNDVAYMSLKFRLLRENGFPASPEPLNIFKYGKSCVNTTIRNDVKGLLSLYEASYLAFEGEETLNQGRTFYINTLRDLMPSIHPHLRREVAHALDLPVHWRTPRLEARWFIDHSAKYMSLEPLILQFAKLDYNNVQNVHQQELATYTSWWRDVALGERLTFARDLRMESFHYANGIVWEPELAGCREMLAKLVTLMVHLDDVYDVYGTLDELVVFTNAIGRWNSSASEMLPEYLQNLYSTIYETSNDVADYALKEHGCNMNSLLQKAWHDLCMAFLVEAKWHYHNYKPTLQEYLDNGWVSSAAPVLLLHAFPMLKVEVTTKSLEQIESYPRLVQLASQILRLCNDNAIHSMGLQRGEALSSIAIYMFENDADEQVSRNAMHDLTMETWKMINEDAFSNCLLPRTFANACMNLARISHCVYRGGDAIGAPNEDIRKQVKELFLDPVVI